MRRIIRRLLTRPLTHVPASRTRPAGLFVTTLEDRLAPAIFIVDNVSDSGTGSLRDAVGKATTTCGSDTINFDSTVFSSPQVINLTTGQITISDSVQINGPGSSMVTVNGAPAASSINRIFDISNATSVITV